MPQMNGFELLYQLGKVSSLVIFTTAYDQYALKAFKFNAIDYLLKPIDKDELIAAVKNRTSIPLCPAKILIICIISAGTEYLNVLCCPLVRTHSGQR